MAQPADIYHLTRQQLLYDLYVAFYDASRHKHKMSYVQKFEQNLAQNLNDLCDDLFSRTYKPLPSKCFVVNYPKKREVFCAAFRDRIVHHLYFRYTHQMFERTFIADTYSCIKGRGTHYGVDRIRQHIRQASHNWSLPCYAMSIDIRGYFMHIDRSRLLTIATDSLKTMSTHRLGSLSTATWQQVLDIDFILWLTREIILLNPMDHCIIVGDASEWEGIDRAKCMRYVAPGLGLPIGNLTSQLFSNVYMNQFDQYIKRTIGCRHYGRYVDDAVIIDPDREWILQQVPLIRSFLHDNLGLDMHMGKLRITDVRHGVEFLGMFIKPHRTYISNKTIRRVRRKIANEGLTTRSIQSYRGIFSHASSHRILTSLIPQ